MPCYVDTPSKERVTIDDFCINRMNFKCLIHSMIDMIDLLDKKLPQVPYEALVEIVNKEWEISARIKELICAMGSQIEVDEFGEDSKKEYIEHLLNDCRYGDEERTARAEKELLRFGFGVDYSRGIWLRKIEEDK